MSWSWKRTRMLLLALLLAVGGIPGWLALEAKPAYAAELKKWSTVGSTGFSPGQVGYTSLAFSDGTPYVAFADWSNGRKATVMKYDGSGWTLVGNGGFSAGAATYIVLKFWNGTPYVAFVDAGNGAKTTIMTLSGNTWTGVGGGSVSSGSSDFASLYIDNGSIYVGYQDQTISYRGVVKKFNGSGWDTVGGGPFSGNQANYVSIAVNNGNVYAGYRDSVDAASRGSVSMFNGSNWSTLGSKGFTPGQASEISVAFYNGKPYMAFQDSANGRRTSVMVYDGGWQMVGNAGFSSEESTFNALVFDNGMPYIAYQTYSGKAEIRKFNGSGWEFVGGDAYFADGAWYTSLAFQDGVPYVAFQDRGKGWKATVITLKNAVAYDGNGSTSGTVPVDGAGYDNNASVKVLANTGNLQKTGYALDGWTLASDGSGTVYRAGDTFALGSSGAILYAKWVLANYTVAYNGNGSTGGSVPASGSYTYDTNVNVAGNTGNLAKTGYVWNGWNTAANGSGTGYAAGDSFKMGEGDVTLYAQWKLGSFPLHYDGNGSTGGTAPADASYEYQSSVTVAGNTGNLVKTGHAFDGWNTAAGGGGTSYAPGSTFVMGAAGVTLYAKWKANSYTVSFNSNGGSAVGSQTSTYGSTASEPAAPTKTGYTFDGWYADSGLSAPYAFTTPITGDTQLYAKWKANSYAVAYDGNGSTGGSVPTGGSYDYSTNVPVAGNTGNLVKTGHSFAGWNTKADGSGTSYGPGDTFAMGAAGVTLYAKWSPNSYTVAYDGNGSTGGSAPASGSHLYGESVAVPGNSGLLVRTGYTFAGWNTAANGSGTSYGAGATLTVGAADVTLYAKWAVNSYSVAYAGNGSTGGSAPAVSYYDYGTSVTVPSQGSLEKTGHTFESWNTAADGSGARYGAGDTFTIGAANVMLHAQWAINSYRVAYDGNGSTGGEAPAGSSHVYDTDVQVAGNPGQLVRTGYTFSGWNTKADGSGATYGESGVLRIGAGDVTLYAKWTVNRYTVSYDGNGGNGGTPPADEGHDYDTSVTVSGNVGSLSLTGYSFAGWNTKADGNGTPYAAGERFAMPADDVTLYAQWAINSYRVAYDGNGSTGGTPPADEEHDYGATVAVSGNSGSLVRTGYTFAGWNTKADGSGTAYAEADTFAIGADDVTLYAQWTINSYRVVYDGNGSTGGEAPAGGSHVYNTNVIVQENFGDLERTGYTFDGWNTAADGSGASYAEGETFRIGAEDVTLYAQWRINSYTVAYDGNGETSGEAPEGGSFDYETTVTVLGIAGGLSRIGHTFAGWNTKADGSGSGYAPGDAFTLGAAGVTLYAVWTVNLYPVFYEGNGSNGGRVPDAGDYAYGSSVTVQGNSNGMTKTGYTFAGWNTAANGSGTRYGAGESFVMGTEGKTLYAQWLSNNAMLFDLSVEQGSLAPAFSPRNLNYDLRLDYEVSGLDFSFAYDEATQAVSVSGAVYQSVAGSVYRYQASDLSFGPNPILIGVTAEDGTVNVYTINAYRFSGSDADLSAITLSSGALSPAFAPGTTSYAASVANSVSSLTVKAAASDPRASVRVGGQQSGVGETSGELSLAVGQNSIEIEVTARDGTTKTYTVNVYRASANSGSTGSGGGGGNGPSAGPDSPIVSDRGQLTLPAGRAGIVSLGDRASFSLPAGAADREVKLTLEEATDAPVPAASGQTLLSPVYAIRRDGSNGAGERFSKPATVTLAFQPDRLKSNQEPGLFYYDEASRTWLKLAGAKTSGNRISAETERTGLFAVFAVERADAPKAGPKFGDVSGHWAEAKIRKAVDAGFVSGYANGTFKPNQTVTRAEFAVMLAKALKLHGEADSLNFSDQDKIGSWAKDAVAQAVQAGILRGFEDGSFRPGAAVSRAEMAAMIANALGRPLEANAETGFADDKDIPAWAKGAVSALRKLGLAEGKGANRFDPSGKMTRAEAVNVLLNLMGSMTQK
ncbi:InlB B-repeat-containing protein [Cohnella sp. REN36]|uniref:InlB B-repeat-containing protein n=1 Tax=Cohnella sp. REN36 TaxID=2887347 RepID=UPI001D1576EB|nr:InlB B-repeat-containing protein [Cohnella sp. REN36]MCC3372633.1 InlB B-repeat-containing protein [Cohnella sp. REN36]